MDFVKTKDDETTQRQKRLMDCVRLATPIYTVLQKYAHIGLKQNLLRSTTPGIITRSVDNTAFVCVILVGRFSKNFSEVRGLRSRGFQLQAEWMATVLCAELWKEA